MAIEAQKQLSDYGITPENSEYCQLLNKHWDAIEVFRNQFIADPENCGEPPTTKQIKAEIQRLEGLVKAKNTETVFYRTSTIKRPRRSKSEMQNIRDGIYAVLADLNPMSDRQVFYQMTSRGYVDKNEAQYKGTVCRLLTEMRLDGTIPYEWITDSTRWMIKPDTYDSMQEALQLTAESYRRALWSRSDCYVEVWLEKQALAGIVNEITSVWDVPLMVNHGFGSISYIHKAAMDIRRIGKPTFIYYLADYDPSGVAAMNNTETRLRQFTPNSEIHFERIGITEEQIKTFHLPTRPTKKSDTRAKAFGSDISVELDALPPKTLRALVEMYVTKHVDTLEFGRLLQIEKQERKTMLEIASVMPKNNEVSK